MTENQIPLFAPHRWDDQPLEPLLPNKDMASGPENLVPKNGKLRITNNYYLDGSILGRVIAISQNRIDLSKKKMDLKEASSKLGIPFTQLGGIISVAKKAELISNESIPTVYGQIILQYDPHLINRGGLWLLHYLLSSNATALSWSRLFNFVFHMIETVSPADIETYYADLQGSLSDFTFSWNGAKELGSILRTYSDHLFRPLGFVMKFDSGKYTVITTEFDIPSYIWLGSILIYKERYYSGLSTLDINSICSANFSPGRLFRQEEKIVRRELEKLHDAKFLTIEARHGLDQVRFKNDIRWIDAIAMYFEERQ
jgi:hypothetical protein